MKFIKKDYICPFCFNKSDLYRVEFRCANDPKRCAPEADTVYSNFRGLNTPKTLSKVIQIPVPATNREKLQALRMPREAVCPHCNDKTSIRICPNCHSELPYTIGDYKDLIFAVIGSKEAGKSHYISVLIDKIMNEIGEGFDSNLQPLNDETIKRYREDFYNPIFRKRETIMATRSGRADISVKLPLIYTLSFMGKGIFSKKRIRDVATIVFFDTAGEDLDAEDTMTTENKYIYNSSGIILLLDPLQLSEVRSQLSSGTPLPEENTEIEDIIARTATLIRKAKKMKQNQLIDIPIALAFSKIDAIDPILDPSSGLKYPGKHTNCFDTGDFEAVNSEMESLIKEWKGGVLLQQMRHNFKHYGFFGFTALGCNPHGTQKIPKLRPHRVEDPFLWLLWRHRLIPSSNQ
jgi:hypothetical protein